MLRPENSKRRVDNLGRITLPKSLRARFYLNEGDEMELFTMDYEGRPYVCLTPAVGVDPKYLAAKEVLEELGAELPFELQEKLK